MALAEALTEKGFRGPNVLPTDVRTFLIRSRVLSRQIGMMRRMGRRVKVVTVVRDAVATNLSGYFYNNHCWPMALREASQRGNSEVLGELAAHFMAEYPHQVPLGWFDLEMKQVFGIDLFAQPFPQEQGYQLLHGEYADLLVLKLDRLNQCADAAFSAFLGLPHFTLVRSNEASEQWYAPLYKAFTDWVVLPEAYLDRLYNSSFTRHFYTESEVAHLRQRWTKSPPLPAKVGPHPSTAIVLGEKAA
jgi:hypothetical protein